MSKTEEGATKQEAATAVAPMMVPRWFIMLGTIVGTLFMPWATWVTLLLVRLEVRFEGLTALSDRVLALEGYHTEHIRFQSDLSSRVRSLEHDLEDLEDDFEKLKESKP